MTAHKYPCKHTVLKYIQYTAYYFLIKQTMFRSHTLFGVYFTCAVNPLNPELYPICYLLALLGAQHFLHVSRIRVKSLTFR